MNTRNRLRRGDALFRLGGAFHALFAICAGLCKTVLPTRGGHEHLVRVSNAFRRNLHRLLSQAKRQHKQLALLFLDLDRFKDINDQLGHTAGDNYRANFRLGALRPQR